MERPYLNKKLKGKIVETFGSQGAFARQIGVREQFVSKVVRGWVSLGQRERAQWARVLNDNAERLFPAHTL